MRKNLFVIGILIFGGVSVAETGETLKETILFSEPIVKEDCVTLAESSSYTPGELMLPIITKVYTFPFGTKIKGVSVTLSGFSSMKVKNISILPSPVPQVKNILPSPVPQKNEVKQAYHYFAGAGLDGEERIIYLVLKIYPIRYSPQERTIYYTRRADIEIKYEKIRLSFPDKYDLVIIAPEEFLGELEPLAEHKNSFGVETILKTTEEIYREYRGKDKPEKIKYFIKDAIERWGVKYILLVGGLNSLVHARRKDDCNQGSKDWFVPVRYSNNEEIGTFDPGFISDLYYADIYDSEGNFCSWDSNGDGIYGGWKLGIGKDILDLYPDVYVGRLACRNVKEVKTMVDKIINYESSSYDSSWFKKIVLIGGDTFDDVASTNYYEGEVENQKVLEYLKDFEPIKIWASNRNTGRPVPEPDDIIRIVSNGCGFLFFAGHGSAERWNTYWPEAFDEERAKGLWWFNMVKLSNGYKLPICVVGGCHNSQFNVTSLCFLNYWLNKIGEILKLDFLKRWPGNVYTPLPECWSWFLTRKIGGGSIATIGNTGTGYGMVGNKGDLDGDGVDDPDCIEVYGGYIETQFFKAYGNGIDILGEAWGKAVTSYLNAYPGMKGQLHCKTVQQWALLGDPSLKIGGYSGK